MYCSEYFLFQSRIKLCDTTELKWRCAFLCYFFFEESFFHDGFETVDDSINRRPIFCDDDGLAFPRPGKWAGIADGFRIIILGIYLDSIDEQIELHGVDSFEATYMLTGSQYERHISACIWAIVGGLLLYKGPL